MTTPIETPVTATSPYLNRPLRTESQAEWQILISRTWQAIALVDSIALGWQRRDEADAAAD